MAKPTKYATQICVGLSVLAFLGIVLGFILKSALVTVLFLLPVVIYEVYRTEGRSTKWSSWGMLGLLIMEIVLIVTGVSFDLVQFFGVSEKNVAGYDVPLGDVKIVGPVLMVVLSVILFVRTRGRYTRWLAVTIFITAFAVVYLLDPSNFSDILKFGVNEVMDRL